VDFINGDWQSTPNKGISPKKHLKLFSLLADRFSKWASENPIAEKTKPNQFLMVE